MPELSPRLQRLPCALVASALLLAGCGGGDASLGGPLPPEPTDVAVEDAFPALPDFNRPVYFAQAPGDADRAFVVTQAGVIRVFANTPAATTSTVFLDLRTKVHMDGEQGLLGLAFDPGYATNGRFYVHYNPAGGTRRSRISRFTVGADRDVADAGSEQVLLEFEQPPAFNNHKGGWIGFGGDGKLYVATGDGGGIGDPSNNAQNLGTLLGKILRIDPDGGIPDDNPFVGQAGRRGEIWAYGLRNPFRASFDRDTGEFWVADVGQSAREEINLVARGGNYGWRKYEGTQVYNATDPVPDDAIAPLYEYGHGNNRCSVTGGYVYRGTALEGFDGAYVYGDFCTGEVWALTRDGSRVINTAIGDVGTDLTSFGEDHDGELYLTALDGRIRKLVPSE